MMRPGINRRLKFTQEKKSRENGDSLCLWFCLKSSLFKTRAGPFHHTGFVCFCALWLSGEHVNVNHLVAPGLGGVAVKLTVVQPVTEPRTYLIL